MLLIARGLCYTKNMEKIITTSVEETRKLGEALAKELKGGEIICLEGELGSGKTAFAQGMLKGLKVEGPYTSPTFLIIKHYKKEIPNPKSQIPNKSENYKLQITNYLATPDLAKPDNLQDIYHIDAYRVSSADILELGWEEIMKNKNNVIIIEWADRIKRIIPKSAIWFKFRLAGKNKRDIRLKT